jgi:two-component system sensor histidine kinase AlgZ
MARIIRQNSTAPALPDFRNLGTVLRIVLAVNGFAAVAALAYSESGAGWSANWLDVISALEPQLVVELAALYALAPWLARQPYSTGAYAVAAVGVASAIVVHLVFGAFGPQPASALLRHLLVTLIATALLLYYFRLLSKALSPAIAEARLQALQARIRPHFLFNSLNAVLSLLRSEPKRAELALQDMADLFRVLMRDNRELAPLADEVELCRQYLALEQLRLGERLQVEWHLQSMPGDALVPPLVLQPLLENAVYHGIEPSKEPGVVSINIFYKGGDVHALLRNPYRVSGGRHHGGNKMALDNVRERLKLHFDTEGTLESRVKADHYEVHVRMPYRTRKHTEPRPAQASSSAGARRDERDRAERVAGAAIATPKPEASRG